VENKECFIKLEFLTFIVISLIGFYLLADKIDRHIEKSDRMFYIFIDLIKEGKK